MSNADEFSRWYSILRGAELFDRPSDTPMFSEREGVVMFSCRDPAEEMTAYATFDADTMVAAGLTAFSLLDNTDKAFVHVAVAPSSRHRGIGSATLEELVAISRRAGRKAVLAASWVPEDQQDRHPHRKFAEKNGFALANIEVRRVLRLPVPKERLAAWAAEVAPSHAGFQLLTYVDDIPDDLLESFCDIRNQQALDAPTGDIEMEAEAITPAVFKERQAIRREGGRTVYFTVAIDARGEVVAYTTLSIPEDQESVIDQWGTLVQRDHRGHRLGMAVKVANLTAVQAAYPQRTFVNTQNSETNGPMVDINERMGFRPVELLLELQRKVEV